MREDQVQQGDVIGRRVDRVPEGARVVAPRDDGRYVIAEGEVTGHAHVIDAAPGVTLHEADGLMYLEVADGHEAVQTHEEHGPATWWPCVWEIGTVREKDWFQQVVRPVVD